MKRLGCIVLTLISLNATLSPALAANTCQTVHVEGRDPRLSGLATLYNDAYQEIIKRSAPELHWFYIYSKSFVEKLDAFFPLINENRNPLYIWSEAERIQIQKDAVRLDELMSAAIKVPASKKFEKRFSDIKNFLNEYLTRHDVSAKKNWTRDEIQALTENSFENALNLGLVQLRAVPRKELKPHQEQILKEMELQAPVDWENGHLDQGYKLLSKPKVSVLQSVSGTDGLTAAYVLVIAARAKDPDRQKGVIEQRFILNDQFEVVKDQNEEFK